MSPAGWWHFLGVLAAEAAIVVAFITLLCRFCRPAWQRTFWQGALVVLLGLFVIEGFGLRWTLHLPSRSAQPKIVERKAVIEVLPTVAAPEYTELPVKTEIPAPAATAYATVAAMPNQLWWPGFVWLAGVALLVLRAVGARVRFLLRYGTRDLILDPVLLSRVSHLAERLEMRGTIRVTESDLLPGPIAFGLRRPEICLPSRFKEMFNPAQQEAVLAHELEHLRSSDPFWYGVSDFVTALWWWNPVMWYARRRLEVATEHAADEASLLVEDGPGALAECLVAMGKALERIRSFNGLGIEGNGFRSSLGRRVSRLLKLRVETQMVLLKPWKARFAYLGSLLVLVLCALSGGAWSSGEKPVASAAWAALQVKPESLPTAQLEPLSSGSSVRETQNGPESSSRSDRSPELKPQQNLVKQAEGDETLEPLDPEKPALYPWLARGTNEPFQTRWFKLDAARLQEKYPGGTNDASMRVFTNLLAVFNAEGLDLRQPKNVFYNDRLAMLMVRGTGADLKTIAKSLRGMGLLVVSSHLDKDLQTRWFKIDPERLKGHFPAIDAGGSGVINSLLTFFDKAGVDLRPPKNIFYSDHGRLMVRGTKEDLQVVESVMEEFKPATGRLRLKVAMFGVPGDGPPDGIGIDHILTRNRAESMFKNAAKTGWELLAESAVTVTNRGRTMLKFKSPPGSRNPAEPIGSTKEGNILPDLLVEPAVMGDGYSISLKLVQTVQQFVGYDLRAQPDWDYVPSLGANPTPQHLQPDRTPRPVHHYRYATNNLTVWDGQTMMVGGLTTTNGSSANNLNKVPLFGDLPIAGRLFQARGAPAKPKNLMIFITPTLVDENGKPVHDPKDLPFNEKIVPPEPHQVK
jgi:beta-lactamase regulating signal transducer with metallopeptidase domain